MSTKILVTGATGFTGGQLCRRLLAESAVVKALIRDSKDENTIREQGLVPVVGDLRDRKSLDRALRGVEIVYHIAAAFRAARTSKHDLYETNVVGTRNLVEAAVGAGVGRFVHCSSVGVHGDVRNPPADENATLAPGDAYQRSKLDGEREARGIAAREGLPLVVFRPAGIYGPGDRRFLKLFKAAQMPVFPMIGSGRVLYHMVFIDDLIDGVLACAKRPEALGNVYILTGPQAVTLNELVSLLGRVLGRQPVRVHVPVTPVYLLSAAIELACVPLGIEPPLFRRRLDLFRKNRAFDISKARRELDYDPKTNLEDGLRKTVDWYRARGLIK